MKPYQWLAWTASIGIIISAVLASFNLYPWYAYSFLFFNLLWALVGILWREKSLFWMNFVISVIYIIGLIFV